MRFSSARWKRNNPEKRAEQIRKATEKRRELTANKPKRIVMGPEVRAQKKQEKRKLRLQTDPQYRTLHNLRKRLRKALTAQKTRKSNRFIELLGCNNQELKLYLESKFQPGMTWDNYGQWHIDHIIPLSVIDLSCQQNIKKVAHYTNLQPLWAVDNLRKGNRRI